MAAPEYSREADVVWRISPDRVLVRHAGAMLATDAIAGAGEISNGGTGNDSAGEVDEAADLMGLAALVWVALDEPATAVQLVSRLAEEDLDRPIGEVDDVARQLVAAGWVRVSDGAGA